MPSNKSVISVSRLWDMLNNNGMGKALERSFSVADGQYAVPKLSYIRGPFSEWWAAKLKERGLGNWETTWDCDDFAWTLYTDIRWAHYATKKSQAEGVSLGTMFYMAGARAEDGTGGGHAINVMVAEDDDGVKKLFFIEPQFLAIGQDPVIHLTPEEKKSCWFVNF